MNRTYLLKFVRVVLTEDTSRILRQVFGRDELPGLFRKIFDDVLFHVLYRTEFDDDDDEIDLQTVLFDYTYSHDIEIRELAEWIKYPGAVEAVDTVLKLHNYDSAMTMFHDAVSEYAKQLIFKLALLAERC